MAMLYAWISDVRNKDKKHGRKGEALPADKMSTSICLDEKPPAH